jgi:hypothetical protein
LLAIYYLAMALLSRIAVPGYASIIITVLIIGGTQLLALGIIGEYLGRLHLNVNRKPQYQVRTALGATGLDRSPAAAAVEPVDEGAQDPRPLARGTRVDLPHPFDGPRRAPSQSREPRP